ncbi:MAG: ATP synthase F1 subunit delta [Candidatus Solibacter usitatus]|nr:ATP synthase F1 subunit delta [Candidatus Solibacter usitatus]
MSNLAVANQYAKALLDAVSAPAAKTNPEEALAHLEQFAAVLKSSHELHNVLLSPAVSHDQKQRVLDRLASMLGLTGLVKNFLFVVTRHRRLNLMNDVRLRFQALLDERAGLVRARIAAAQPLSDNQKVALEGVLASVTGKQVRCGYEVDAALLGGVSVRVGSTMYDGSVRGQLDGLRRRLTSK